jgi:7-cyano-7-deazaguanine synthase
MKSIVVLSGGLDSATVLGFAVEKYGNDQVGTLSFNYGSKHNLKENLAAKKIASFYQVSNTIIHLPFVGEYFKSDLLNTGGHIPDGHYAADNMKKTVVPYRNAIMLSIAAGFAASNGVCELLIGNHAGDHDIYPDCRKEFMQLFQASIRVGDWNPVRIERPFELITKDKLLSIGLALKVPYHLTWSCYKGEEKPCGTCGTCVERLEAFQKNLVSDPLNYNDPITFETYLK